MTEKLSDKEIALMISKTGDTYIGTKSGLDRVDSSDILLIKCGKCGETYEKNWANWSTGQRCKYCGRFWSHNKATYYIKSKGDKLLGQFVRAKDKIDIWCHKCETTRNIRLSEYVQGQGCKGCQTKAKRDKQIKLVLDKIRSKEDTLIGNIQFKEYNNKGNMAYFDIKCNTCQDTRSTNWAAYKKAKTCKTCHNHSKQYTHEYVSSEINKKGDKLLNIYNNSKSSLKIQCGKCNKKYSSTWNSYSSGDKRCSICYGRQLSIEKIKEKIKYLDRDASDYVLLSTECDNFTTKKLLWRCSNNHEYEQYWGEFREGGRCPKCQNIINGAAVSQPHQEIWNYIESISKYNYKDKTLIINDRGQLGGTELDIYIPELNFAIEYSGIYWHCDIHTGTNIKQRHLTKAKDCHKLNINLLVIDSEQWNTKQELCKSMIRQRLKVTKSIVKVRPNKCDIKKIDKNIQFRDFFESNHMAGHSSASYAYGLFYNNILISCLSIRTNHAKETEICRFANHQDYYCYGGFPKLLKTLIKLENIQELISYSDNRVGMGNVYQNNGFELIQQHQGYCYTDCNITVPRFKCKRINDTDILQRWPQVQHTELDQCKSGMTSQESLGWKDPIALYKFWDYGHKKWKLTF